MWWWISCWGDQYKLLGYKNIDGNLIPTPTHEEVNKRWRNGKKKLKCNSAICWNIYFLRFYHILFSFSSLSRRYQGLKWGWGGWGSPGPEFARLFHGNPACQTPVISNPNTIFFPNSASCAKIFANPASWVTVNSRHWVPSINFAFSRIPHYISGQIPDTEKPLSDSAGSAWRLYLYAKGQCADTLGARDFSSAVSGFCQVFIARLRRSWLRPTPKIPAAREKNLWYPG